MYKGLIRDRLQTLPTRYTRAYKTDYEAHRAAERLEKKYGVKGCYRYEVDVIYI